MDDMVVFACDVNGHVRENQYRICWCTWWIWLWNRKCWWVENTKFADSLGLV